MVFALIPLHELLHILSAKLLGVRLSGLYFGIHQICWMLNPKDLCKRKLYAILLTPFTAILATLLLISALRPTLRLVAFVLGLVNLLTSLVDLTMALSLLGVPESRLADWLEDRRRRFLNFDVPWLSRKPD